MTTSTLSAARDPKLMQLYQYRLSIAPRDGVLPGRQHFDPLDIPSLLPWVRPVDVRERRCASATACSAPGTFG